MAWLRVAFMKYGVCIQCDKNKKENLIHHPVMPSLIGLKEALGDKVTCAFQSGDFAEPITFCWIFP